MVMQYKLREFIVDAWNGVMNYERNPIKTHSRLTG